MYNFIDYDCADAWLPSNPPMSIEDVPDGKGALCGVLENTHCSKGMLANVVNPLQEASHLHKREILIWC